jgi:hypothetical protein
MEKVNEQLKNIQEIRNALVDMQGLTKKQRSQIANWIAVAVINGFNIAGQENDTELLQTATWNLTGI